MPRSRLILLAALLAAVFVLPFAIERALSRRGAPPAAAGPPAVVAESPVPPASSAPPPAAPPEPREGGTVDGAKLEPSSEVTHLERAAQGAATGDRRPVSPGAAAPAAPRSEEPARSSDAPRTIGSPGPGQPVITTPPPSASRTGSAPGAITMGGIAGIPTNPSPSPSAGAPEPRPSQQPSTQVVDERGDEGPGATGTNLPPGGVDLDDPTDPPLPSTPALVRMVAEPALVTIGTPLTVHVAIADATNVGSVPFHVKFDPAVLRYERGDEGPFLQGRGRQTAFFAVPTSSRDTVVVGLSRLGKGSGIDGGGELCALHFTAVGQGSATLQFSSASVRDALNRVAPSSFQAASVVVH